jgi:uncharacterized HhH-GPD family protein
MSAMAKPKIPITGNLDADRLLSEDPLALLVGMLLDQQVPMEWAFLAPWRLKERLGGRLDAAEIAAMDPETLTTMFKGPPALHRFPGSMAKRVQALCQHIVDEYDGDATAVWKTARSGSELFARLTELPGYGVEKSRIFTALLAKRLKVRPSGWEEAAGPFADDTPRSVADVDSAEALAKVREFKRTMKAKGKGKAD